MSKVEFDSKTQKDISDTIGKNLSGTLQAPLAKVLEESKDGIQPLIGFYIAAKKGKSGITKLIAKDVANRLFYKFADDFMEKWVSNLSFDVDIQKDNATFSLSYAPYDKNISNIFKINETNPPAEHEEEMKFHLYLYGGFNNLKISKGQNNMKRLSFGELSGTLVVSIRKFPFMPENAFLETSIFEKNISVGLSQFSALIK